MPALGFGTYQINDDDVVAAVETAIKLGYRHIDTAQAYENEVGVGKGLVASGVDTSEFFITTKLWPGNPDWGNAVQIVRREVHRGYEGVSRETRRRLGRSLSHTRAVWGG